MFDNIGKKIMALTKIVCTAGITLSVILGIILIVGDMIGVGIAAAILLSLACWLGSFMLYAFGQLIDDTHAIREFLGNKKSETKAPIATVNEANDLSSKLSRIGSLSKSSYTPAPAPAPEFNPASKAESAVDETWICECGTRNSPTARSCSICYTPRPSKKK